MANKNDLQTFVASTSFCFCSVGMLYYNKVAISAFPLQCTLVAGQMMFAVLVVLVFGWPWLRIGSARDALRWMLVTPTFTGMLLTSVLALKYSPMSCIVVFRGLSPLGTLVLEQFYPHPVKITTRMWQSMIVMVVGTALYVVHMPARHMTGMWWAILNSSVAVADRLIQRYLLSQDKVDVSKMGLTLLSNLYSFPVVLGLAFALGEFPQVHDYVPFLRFYDQYCILVSCFIGLGISFCGIWAQSLMTATSFLVLINANKFVIIGVEALGGQRALTWMQIVGTMATIIAACVYTHEREMADESEAQETSISETKALLAKTYQVQGPGHKMV
eukprot:TRINITY_DN1890_c0_g1_i1.p1 TRINITY_DN1890_c0_g1~~TRINITY_DN1890_c0_g1_i1.p1  ORF type:complete len:330 (+),score=51.66 TRINITY_DN1890_c0_g1_i1:113-1102(+)